MIAKSRHLGTTQADIAHALNVSRPCVAIALNPKTRHRLLPETVARVEAKAKELHYHPQRQARILRSGRSHTVGVVFSSSDYHAPRERIRHLVREAIHAGYQLVPVDMHWFDFDYSKAEHYLLDLAVEGIVLSNLTDETAKYWNRVIKRYRLPTVVLGKSHLSCDQAQPDLVSAFREMTLHHIGQGSRHLHLLLSSHDSFPKGFVLGDTLANRVRGFVEAIRSVGGEVAGEGKEAGFLKLPTTFPRNRSALRGSVHYPLRQDFYQNAFDTGYYETLRLLKSKAIDSLICSNDDIATGAKAACVENGVLIPEQIKISGSDNAPFGRYGRNPLSTIEHPSEAMAKWCIQRIIRRIEHPELHPAPKQKLFPCKLIYRGSTASPCSTSKSSKNF